MEKYTLRRHARTEMLTLRQHQGVSMGPASDSTAASRLSVDVIMIALGQASAAIQRSVAHNSHLSSDGSQCRWMASKQYCCIAVFNAVDTLWQLQQHPYMHAVSGMHIDEGSEMLQAAVCQRALEGFCC